MPILVITGPTAVGKTSLSIALAKELNAEIISADSRQVYKELNIGVAKPTFEELRSVRHHFISEISIEQPFTAADFSSESAQRIKDITTRGKNVIITGGTGLYLKALLEGLSQIPDTDEGIREKLNEIHVKEGLSSLQEKLKKTDPEYYAEADINNPRRVIRALEVTISTGKKYSEFLGKRQPLTRSIVQFCLNRDRKTLYGRIDARVDKMIEEGLPDEALALYKYRDRPALNTVGYKELFKFNDGDLTLSEAIELIKKNTRNYAKRQLTWFRNKGNYSWVNIEDEAKASEEILERMRTFI